MTGETINNGSGGNSLYDSWNNAFSGEQNKITVKEWCDDRLFRRDALPISSEYVRYESNRDFEFDTKGNVESWDRITAAFNPVNPGYKHDGFTYDTLVQDMDSRLSSGEYMPSEQVDSEESKLHELIDSRAKYESERIEESIEKYQHHVVDRDDLEESLINRYEDTLRAVVAESTNDVKADGSRPSIATACDHLIAKKVRAMSIKAKAGPISKQDQENFSLALHDIGTIRAMSENLKTPEYTSLHPEN